MKNELQVDGSFEIFSVQDVFDYAWAFSWLLDQADRRGLPPGIIKFLSEFSCVFSAETARLSGFSN